MLRPRNRVAMAPIMRKGGVHVSAKSGERQSDRQSLIDEVAEVLVEREIDAEKLSESSDDTINNPSLCDPRGHRR